MDHGILDRKEADRRLIKAGAVDGAFLLRTSDKDQTKKILSVCTSGRVHHAVIESEDRGNRTLYWLPGENSVKVGSLEQLVELYRDPQMGHPAPLGDALLPSDECSSPPSNKATLSAAVDSNPFLVASSNLDHSNPFANSAASPAPVAPANGVANTTPSIAHSRSLKNEAVPALSAPSDGEAGPAAESESADAPTWACSLCTYLNDALLPQCEMCETPRPKSRKNSAIEEMKLRDRTDSFDRLPKVETGLPEDRRTNPFAAQSVPTPKDDFTAAARRTQSISASAIRPKSSSNGASTRRASLGASDARRTTREILLCEGSLVKVRGPMQNRSRWFVLTTKKFMYYEKNGAALISSVLVEHIVAVTDVSERRFRISTTAPFGASGTHEMLLEAPSQAVKFKWLKAMKGDSSSMTGFSSNRAELIVEGPLLKIQPFGTVSRTRWFRVTTKKFCYLENEAGEELGSTPFDRIVSITIQGTKGFILKSQQPFTKSGSYEVNCRCPSDKVLQKWITGLARVIPTSLFIEA